MYINRENFKIGLKFFTDFRKGQNQNLISNQALSFPKPCQLRTSSEFDDLPSLFFLNPENALTYAPIISLPCEKRDSSNRNKLEKKVLRIELAQQPNVGKRSHHINTAREKPEETQQVEEEDHLLLQRQKPSPTISTLIAFSFSPLISQISKSTSTLQNKNDSSHLYFVTTNREKTPAVCVRIFVSFLSISFSPLRLLHSLPFWLLGPSHL